MEYLVYISKFLYRIRWWLIIGTLSVTLLAIFVTKKMTKKYSVDCTIYTGIISGYSIEGDGTKDWSVAQNAMDNLINIILSEATLQKVCIRLYARCLINGNPNKDNEFISAYNYKKIYNHVRNSPQGPLILGMINKNNEDETVEKFTQLFNSNRDNYLYGLFHYNAEHFSFNALKNIKVEREGSSDLLHVTYVGNDRGIAYNTLLILSKEFVNEYRSIRYGETDKVIDYFKQALTSAGIDLHSQENDLTQYNISKRVINYTDETKEIAAINKEFELRNQDVLMSYNSSRAALKELEKQMDANTKHYITNAEFITKLKQVSDLQYKVSESEILPNSNNDEKQLTDYKNRLSKAKDELSGISDKYLKNQYTKQGIAKNDIVDNWLEELITFEKAKADLKVIEKARNDLNGKYTFFAPVGSTIKQKERSINFTEQNYLSLLKSYDDALMRKKNLEMTSASLKVLNPPSYPLISLSGVRKKIVIGAFLGSFLFIFGFFLLIEVLDQTLRDSVRTRRITGGKVLGSFPAKSIFKYRNYNETYSDIATKYLSSSISQFFNKKQQGMPYIVNMLSMEAGAGKSYISEQLVKYWNSIGLKAHKLTAGTDFNTASKEYILSTDIKDLYSICDEDVLIVEYAPLSNTVVPSFLLQQANINLIIARADKGWKTSDKITYNKLKDQIGNAPLYFYLNQASREEVESYTGMLPPYNYFRKRMYQLSHLALTEHSSLITPNQGSTDIDDNEEK